MGQDWGGRKPLNPPGVPRVTRQQVLDAAAKLGVKVRRVIRYSAQGSLFQSDRGWWQYEANPGDWRGIGDTNYWAAENLWSMIHEMEERQNEES
jgi:hypothetical protein